MVADGEPAAVDGPLPKLVVFDLDYTLWPLWVDTHVDPPLKRRHETLNEVVDSSGQRLSFYPHVPSILLGLRRAGIGIGAASRTAAPSVARQALRELLLDQEHAAELIRGPRRSAPPSKARSLVKAISLFDYLEIYPGSKVHHFQRIARESGVDYSDMLFFDDEHRNSEVQRKLGVHFVEVGLNGLDRATFERGIREWQDKQTQNSTP